MIKVECSLFGQAYDTEDSIQQSKSVVSSTVCGGHISLRRKIFKIFSKKQNL